MCLEHGELWDEHLVDDVHDAVVGDHVRLKHLPTIDRDAFSCVVSVVCGDIQNPPCVGNDRNAFCIFMGARASGVSSTPRSFSE